MTWRYDTLSASALFRHSLWGWLGRMWQDMIRVHRLQNTMCDVRIVKSVIRQVLAGLDFLHANWIMHRYGARAS